MYDVVALAGTFDRLHKGHQYFISSAFSYGRKVVIGLTSDQYAWGKSKIKIQNSKIQIKIQKYSKRETELLHFLKENGLLSHSEIIKIHDVYGTAIEPNEIEALVVTRETIEGGKKVNKKRKEFGLVPLKIIEIPIITDINHHRISSTRIRNGEIDRWGHVLKKVSLRLVPISEKLRSKLKVPVGNLIKGNPDDLISIKTKLKNYIKLLSPNLIITVGDQVTKTAHTISLAPKLSIIDFYVNRKKKYSRLTEFNFKAEILHDIKCNGLIRVKNPAGMITEELISSVHKALRAVISEGRAHLIFVDGEEDLAGLPAVLLAPLGSVVLYGQPGKGIVAVEVNEKIKERLVGMIESE